MTSEYVENRLARLRAEWPARSIVDTVMAEIGAHPEPAAAHRSWIPRLLRTRRLAAALTACGLFAALGLAWLLIASHPTTLLAAIEGDLSRAASAHISIISRDERNQQYKADIWYRRNVGLRVESPGETIVEDGRFQWSWKDPGPAGETIVLRQPRTGFLRKSLAPMLALPDIPSFMTRDRAHELDRVVEGHACLGYIVTQTGRDPDLPPGATPVNPHPFRLLVLAEADGRIHEVIFQERMDDQTWRSVREFRIAYDVPVPDDRVAARFPAGARVIDREKVFEDRYPLERAIYRIELGGLILAIHNICPLINRDGFYVVSSVRGTAEFLKKFPPRRRTLNWEVSELDVAIQSPSSGNLGAKYNRVVLAKASREGVEFMWWLIIPRRYFVMKDGQRVMMPETDTSWMPGEPGRLDDLSGKARVLLSVYYWDEQHRTPQGAMGGVEQWVEVPLPADQGPNTIDNVAAFTRQDLQIMQHGGSSSLFGVAADTKDNPQRGNPLSVFEPDRITEAEYIAAVRRGVDDLRRDDEVHLPDPSNDLPPAGKDPAPPR
jgi:hypothetical protein